MGKLKDMDDMEILQKAMVLAGCSFPGTEKKDKIKEFSDLIRTAPKTIHSWRRNKKLSSIGRFALESFIAKIEKEEIIKELSQKNNSNSDNKTKEVIIKARDLLNSIQFGEDDDSNS